MKEVADIILDYIVPSLGIIFAFSTFIAPVGCISRAVRHGHLGELNPIPWIFMTGNAIGWIAYAFATHDFFVLAANGPGFIISLWLNKTASTLLRKEEDAYQLISNENSDDTESPKSDTSSREEEAEELETENTHVISLILAGDYVYLTSQEKGVLAIVSVWITYLVIIGISGLDHHGRKIAIGVAVDVNLAIFFAAPLTTIFRVIESSDSSSIHLPTMYLNTLCAFFWLIYGLSMLDVFKIIPDGAGVIFGLCQFYLYKTYPHADFLSDSESESGEELDEDSLSYASSSSLL